MPRPKIGRPKKGSAKITPKQEKFVTNYLETGNATQSAKEAGYSSGSASVTGSRLLQNKAVATVIDDIRRDVAQELKDKAYVAYDVLQNIMLDNDCSFKVRADVASNLLDRAGYKAVERKEVSATGNISNTITLDLVQRARFMLANKAKTIDVIGEVID